MSSTEFCIKWTNYQTNIVNSVGKLRNDDEFVDVTLVCDDKRISAHKVILSACSDYFKEVFKVKTVYILHFLLIVNGLHGRLDRFIITRMNGLELDHIRAIFTVSFPKKSISNVPAAFQPKLTADWI